MSGSLKIKKGGRKDNLMNHVISIIFLTHCETWWSIYALRYTSTSLLDRTEFMESQSTVCPEVTQQPVEKVPSAIKINSDEVNSKDLDLSTKSTGRLIF